MCFAFSLRKVNFKLEQRFQLCKLLFIDSLVLYHRRENCYLFRFYQYAFALIVSAHTGGAGLGADTYAYTPAGACELAHLSAGRRGRY